MNILKIDYDEFRTLPEVKTELKKRLSYIYDLKLISLKYLRKIETVKKTNYCVRIYFTKNFKCESDIIILQLLLGSDWMKETNTYLNHFVLNMQYSNRIFTTKRYKGNKIKTAKIKNITLNILTYLKSKTRKKNKN